MSCLIEKQYEVQDSGRLCVTLMLAYDEFVSLTIGRISPDVVFVNTDWCTLDICSFIRQCNTFTSYILLRHVSASHGHPQLL
jgi:hypothetical protein